MFPFFTNHFLDLIGAGSSFVRSVRPARSERVDKPEGADMKVSSAPVSPS